MYVQTILEHRSHGTAKRPATGRQTAQTNGVAWCRVFEARSDDLPLFLVSYVQANRRFGMVPEKRRRLMLEQQFSTNTDALSSNSLFFTAVHPYG